MECKGTMIFQIYTAREARPIANARVTVTDPSDGSVRTFTTNSSGRTPQLCVTAPDPSLSLNPENTEMPFKRYNATIEAPSFIPVTINGIEAFAGREVLQEFELEPMPKTAKDPETINLPPNQLYQKPQDQLDEPNDPLARPPVNTGAAANYRTARTVYIPQYITVHLGSPHNASARNVTVSFPNYIKNVASSEIYPTWPDASLRANILAQISFALNRIYTEWYRSRGFDFDITNNTAYDQFYVYGRNIFGNISQIVDDIFNEYVRKQGAINPYFTEYCNGTTVTCAGMSQWGTVSLAEKGFTPLAILKYYYGNDVEITSTNDIRPIESSYPGTPLGIGTVSPDVRTIENRINRIRRNYPAIPIISNVDNTFTSETEAAVQAFQRIFNLTPDGIIGPGTWNKINYIYVAVTRLAELNGEQEQLLPQPTAIFKVGSTGPYVQLAQYFLRVIANYYLEVRPIAIDGIFGPETKSATIDFQKRFGLDADGIIGPKTWQKLYDVFLGIANSTGLGVAYPGFLLKEGSRGDNVWLMQDYLRTIANNYPIPTLVADGIFGPKTTESVKAFQTLFGLVPDGIIGQKTWERIVAVRLLIA